MYNKIIKNIKKKMPIVHTITNYVTVNDCANITLAIGASPIMADDIEEVEDIVEISSALVINIGTLNKNVLGAMLCAGKHANKIGKPVILDPVGAGASTLRNNAVSELLKGIQFSVIRGNISEIKFIAGIDGETKGVDASEADQVTEQNIDRVIEFARALSKQTKSVIVITGAIDIVANEEKAYVIKNGHPMMARVTGTGCMLSSVLGSFVGANSDNTLTAAAYGVCAMGLCGEIAYQKTIKTDGGTSTFRTNLIDAMSKMTPEILEEGAKFEIR